MNKSKVDLSTGLSIHCSGNNKEGKESFSKLGQQLIYMTMPSEIRINFDTCESD